MKIKIPHWSLLVLALLFTVVLAWFNPDLYEATLPDFIATFVGVIAGFSVSLTVEELSKKQNDKTVLESLTNSLTIEIESHVEVLNRLYQSRKRTNFVVDYWLDTGGSTAIYQSSMNSGTLSLLNPEKQLELSTYYRNLEMLSYLTKLLVDRGNIGTKNRIDKVDNELRWKFNDIIEELYKSNKEILPLSSQ